MYTKRCRLAVNSLLVEAIRSLVCWTEAVEGTAIVKRSPLDSRTVRDQVASGEVIVKYYKILLLLKEVLVLGRAYCSNKTVAK